MRTDGSLRRKKDLLSENPLINDMHRVEINRALQPFSLTQRDFFDLDSNLSNLQQ